MTFEEEKIESAKLGMILDSAIDKPRGYVLLYERENGHIGVVIARTPTGIVVSILRQMADIIERQGSEIQHRGQRQYPGSEEQNGTTNREQRTETAGTGTAD